MLAINLNSRIINEKQIASDYFPATSPAYRLGAYAAQLQEICIPENYFVFRNDQKEFCRGYVSVAGHTITTRQILGVAQ